MKDKKQRAQELLHQLAGGTSPNSLFHPVILAKQSIQILNDEPVESYMELHEHYAKIAKGFFEEHGNLKGLTLQIKVDERIATVIWKEEDPEDEERDDGAVEEHELPEELKEILDGVADVIQKAIDKKGKGKNTSIEGDDFLGN